MDEPANAPPGNRIADRLRAVVLDANCMPKGRINLKRLGQWAEELHSESIELWLPEPVVWEWAEHSAADRAAATSAYEVARPGLLAAGFNLPEVEELSQEEATQVVIDAIQAVHENIFVIEVDGTSSRAALRDQILDLPPASKISTGDKRRPTVKTGAADSAAVRSIHTHAGGSSDYAVVTADDHWRETYEAQGWDVPLIYRSMRDLRRVLFSITSADEAVPRILSFVARSIAQRDGRIEVGSLSGGGRLIADPGEDEQEVNVTTVEVDLIQAVAGLEGVELVEETGALLARVYLLADVHVTTMSIDPSGLFFLPKYRLVSDALVRGRMYFEVSDGIIMSARPESESLIAVDPSDEYMEAEEAFFEALDALSTLPGLHQLDWPEAFEGERSWSGELANGRVIELELEGSVFEDWKLTVRLPDDTEPSLEETLMCSYDSDAWAGGSEGLYRRPPWQLRLADLPFGGSAPWQLNARVLRVAYGLPSAGFSAETGIDDR
jgi:hypothetical protein